MAKAEESARDRAIAWHLRLDDADEAEWDSFLDWLDLDRLHRAEFDRIELADAELKDAIGRSFAAGVRAGGSLEDRRSAPLKWPLLTGAGAVAASLTLALLIGFRAEPTIALVATQTQPGEQRTLVLSDGSRLFLNGGTRILLDPNNSRFARIERGEATFDVRHNATSPFNVEVGAIHLQDAGTIFNVTMERGGFELGVAEGAVIFNPNRENVKLTRGATLRFRPGNEPAVLGAADPKSIGAWREGQLIYDREPLQNVAADIKRTLGTSVFVAPEIAKRPFTGVILIDRNQDTFVPRLGGLLGVDVSRSQAGWYLGPQSRAHSNVARGAGGNRA